MADEDLDLDVKGGGKSNNILLIVLIVLLLAVGGGGAAFFLLGDKEEPEAGAEAEHAAEKIEPKEAHYMELKPEFVVNFEDNSRVNYMQVDIQVMARDKAALSVIERHMPVIRNNIMLLLSSQKYEEVRTREGKEKMREAVLSTIQEIVHGESDKLNVDAVYFTSLVMQ